MGEFSVDYRSAAEIPEARVSTPGSITPIARRIEAYGSDALRKPLPGHPMMPESVQQQLSNVQTPQYMVFSSG